jgi:hypothetical protein
MSMQHARCTNAWARAPDCSEMVGVFPLLKKIGFLWNLLRRREERLALICSKWWERAEELESLKRRGAREKAIARLEREVLMVAASPLSQTNIRRWSTYLKKS